MVVFTLFHYQSTRAETQDGGDAKVEASPRDIVYTEPAEPSDGETPLILHQLDLRYGYAADLSLCFFFLAMQVSKLSANIIMKDGLIRFCFCFSTNSSFAALPSMMVMKNQCVACVR